MLRTIIAFGHTWRFLIFVSMIERQKPWTERLLGESMQLNVTSSPEEFLRKLSRHVDPEPPSGMKHLTGSDHRYYGQVSGESFDLRIARLPKTRNRPYGSFRGTFLDDRLSIEVNSFDKILFFFTLSGPLFFFVFVSSINEIREAIFLDDTFLGGVLPLLMVLFILGSPLLTIYLNRRQLIKTIRQELTEIDREA